MDFVKVLPMRRAYYTYISTVYGQLWHFSMKKIIDISFVVCKEETEYT